MAFFATICWKQLPLLCWSRKPQQNDIIVVCSVIGLVLDKEHSECIAIVVIFFTFLVEGEGKPFSIQLNMKRTRIVMKIGLILFLNQVIDGAANNMP